MLVLLVLLLLMGPAWSQTDYELSYLLVRSSDGEILAEQEADKLRIPASTLKTVTAAATLEHLGRERVFKTNVRTRDKVHRGRLKGSICLQGEADPELTLDSLRSLVTQLKASGLRVVEGDLVVDPGPFAFPLYGTGWAWDDAGYSYSPEITGLNLGPLEVRSESLPHWVVYSPGESSGAQLIPGWEGAQVRGELPRSVSPPRVALRTGERFLELLADAGIKVQGEVQEGEGTGRILATHRSRPVEQILKQAMAVSDNLAMELLYRASERALPEALKEEKLRVVDGSGLSRYNLISCRQLVHLLGAVDLRGVLPAPGEGTLRRRFLDGWARGNLVAKTGTMSNVSALTGYLFPGSDKECRFAIMINGHLEATSKRKAIEDELVERWAQEIGWPYVLGRP